MKNLNLLVISKGRKYYKCKVNDKYDCKLISTEELELNKVHNLLVEDISVRSKYGTDLIYSTVHKVDKDAGVVALKHDKYNEILVDKCKKLGGKWDSEEKAWVFPKIVENEVEELDMLFNDNIINIEIKAKEVIYGDQAPVEIFGYNICRASGRDSDAKLSDNVSMMSGKISSGGSIKNWVTRISEGSIFRLSLSKNLLEKYNEEKWDIKILN